MEEAVRRAAGADADSGGPAAAGAVTFVRCFLLVDVDAPIDVAALEHHTEISFDPFHRSVSLSISAGSAKHFIRA